MLENLTLESDPLLRGGVVLARSGDAEDGEIVRVEPRIDLKEAVEALAEETGGDEKNDSGREFDYNEI